MEVKVKIVEFPQPCSLCGSRRHVEANCPDRPGDAQEIAEAA